MASPAISARTQDIILYSKFCFKRKGKGSGENLKAVVETEDSDDEYLF